jgi:hypothetical protein
LPAPRPPRNNQHHDRSGGGSCASRAAKTQSSYQLIGFLRGHLVDFPAQLVHALNFTQKAISHRRRRPLFATSPSMMLASYIIDERADFLGRQQQVAAVKGRLGREWASSWVKSSAEVARRAIAETAHLSTRAAADMLNRRGIRTGSGKQWHPARRPMIEGGRN